MGSFESQHGSLPHAVKLGLATLLVAAFGSLAEVAGTQVAGAAGAPSWPTVRGYTPGATTPANQFNVMTLVTGGAANVNTASLTVVTHPVERRGDGGHHLDHRDPHYTPARRAHGHDLPPSPTAPRRHLPVRGNAAPPPRCRTPATAQYMGQETRGLYGILSPINTAVTAPSSAPQGPVFTVVTAPAASTVPTTEVGLTVTNVSAFTAITPIPAGFTYVAGSLAATGGDANSTGRSPPPTAPRRLPPTAPPRSTPATT